MPPVHTPNWAPLRRTQERYAYPFERILAQKMGLFEGTIQPWETPEGKLIEGNINRTTARIMPGMMGALSSAGVSGPQLQALWESGIDQSHQAVGSALNQYRASMDPTPMATKRGDWGISMANLREQARHNWAQENIAEKQLEAAQSGGAMGGIGSLVGGVAKLGMGLAKFAPMLLGPAGIPATAATMGTGMGVESMLPWLATTPFTTQAGGLM